ncbi:MAG: D-alanine--D-alanine ligase [Balneola sp.]|nr:D-alanine--D-alanine ligase [Balneola sp.]|tara:strand:+ start:5095 stop:6276 length:1182 start_codon:yes stop_codon:yes gene_type:complete
MTEQTPHLVVAFGGVSPEHEVSVLTAMQVMSTLSSSKYTILPLYISKSGQWLTGDILKDLEQYGDLDTLTQQASPCYFNRDQLGRVVFEYTKKGLFSKPIQKPIYAVVISFHGGAGENGSFQGICEQYNLPYTGSGVLASSLGMDKVKAKQLCEANHIPVTSSLNFYEEDWDRHIDTILKEVEQLGYPVIVKPSSLGSSIGVKKVESQSVLIKAVETAFRYDAQILIEEAIAPLIEINCAVLGTPESSISSVCERPVGRDEALSFADKYQRGGGEKGIASADRVIPADISEELSQNIRALSEQIFRIFQATGVARIDYLVQKDTQKVYFNEINTIPGSFSYYLWEYSKLNFNDLLDQLIETAIIVHQQKNGRILHYKTNLLNDKAATGLKGIK